MSSLTVARQRGIHTRFPIFVRADKNARTNLKELKKRVQEISLAEGVKVNCGGGPSNGRGERLGFGCFPHREVPGFSSDPPSPRSCALRHLRGGLSKIFGSKELIDKIFETKNLAPRSLSEKTLSVIDIYLKLEGALQDVRHLCK
jgi:hypothetical protein